MNKSLRCSHYEFVGGCKDEVNGGSYSSPPAIKKRLLDGAVALSQQALVLSGKGAYKTSYGAKMAAVIGSTKSPTVS